MSEIDPLRALIAQSPRTEGTVLVTITFDKRELEAALSVSPPPQPALPPSLQASIDLFREDPVAWHAEWQRTHDFKVGLLEKVRALEAVASPPPTPPTSKCTCWMGRGGALGGDTRERIECLVHGDPHEHARYKGACGCSDPCGEHGALCRHCGFVVLVPPPSTPPAPLTFVELDEANRSRVLRWHPEGLLSWSPLEWAGAMAGEAGEACNAAKKLKRIDDGLKNINTEEGRSLTDRKQACRHRDSTSTERDCGAAL